MVKNLPAKQETQVQSLGREDHLEEEMATHSGILAWRIPWAEEPGGLQSMDSKASQKQLRQQSTRVKQITRGKLFTAQEAQPVLCDDLERWDGSGAQEAGRLNIRILRLITLLYGRNNTAL